MVVRALLLLAVALSVVAHAAPSGCFNELTGGEAFSSPYLSARVTNVEMRSGEEEMGFALYGSVDGGDSVFLGRINPHYTDDPTAVSIDEVTTSEFAQGNGVATALYDFLLKRHEEHTGSPAKKLTGTSKVSTNLEVPLKSLVKSLASESGYKKPNPADDVKKQFYDCCRDIFEKYPEKIEAAIQESPTYKIGKKFGFEICKGTMKLASFMNEDRPDAVLNYELCR